MKREEEGRVGKVAMGILAAVVFAPMLLHALAYAFIYVVCSFDSCFSVGL